VIGSHEAVIGLPRGRAVRASGETEAGRGGRPPILLVEHALEVGRPLCEQLAADGYEPLLARTAEHARVLARAHSPALALLGDLEHPRAALGLLAEIRGGSLEALPAGLPVIVVSAYAGEPDVLRAFDAGADDFLARPAPYLQLLARVGSGHAPCVEVGPLAIDPRAHAVTLHRAPVQLRRLEYELLVHLAREPRRVCPRRELLDAVWGLPAVASTRTLDSHASRLRRKLRAGSGERWVINVRGVGYRLL